MGPRRRDVAVLLSARQARCCLHLLAEQLLLAGRLGLRLRLRLGLQG